MGHGENIGEIAMSISEKVSVIMPVYNGAQFLDEAIQSVLDQTYKEFELLLVNDGSKDKSLEIAERYAKSDSRVRVISHENMGMAKTLNDAIAQAQNERIARIDQDDLMEPNRLERQLAYIQRYPDVDILSSFVKIIDDSGQVLAEGKSPLISYDAVEKLHRSGEMIGFHHPAVMMRKSSVLNAGGFRSQFWPVDDVDLWARMLEKGYKVLVQPEFLTRYRVHGGSTSIAKAMEARKKVTWVKECMSCRRNDRAEPAWEDFCNAQNNMPVLFRANRWRKDSAKVFYKSAAFNFAQKKVFSAVYWGGLSFLLQPRYILGKRLG
jgi:glycosyltransferase involved in cell wall biosynthesis